MQAFNYNEKGVTPLAFIQPGPGQFDFQCWKVYNHGGVSSA